jgi:hypothetical protein
MLEHDEKVTDELGELDVGPEPEAHQQPHHHDGGGVACLHRLLKAQGTPDLDSVVELMNQFPNEYGAMLELLHRRLGNSYVQQVLAALSAGNSDEVAEPEVSADDPQA